MKKRPKRINDNKRGLLHGPTRIEVEAVTARHKKACSGCADVPEGTRLKIVEGGGRAATTLIYCASCGEKWLDDHLGDVMRARTRLLGEDVCVRLTES